MASSEKTPERLRVFLSAHESGEFTFDRLAQIAEQDDSLDVARALADLVTDGVLQQFVRVESPLGHGGIGDFESVLDVPERILDWRSDREIDVGPENLRLMYRAVRRAG